MLVLVPAQVFYGECFPLELVCPGLIHLQNSSQTLFHQHLRFLYAYTLGYSCCVQQPALFLPLLFFHIEPLFCLSIMSWFSSSYQQSLPHPSCPDPDCFHFIPSQRKQRGKKRLMKQWESLPKLSRQWAHWFSENNDDLKYGAWIDPGLHNGCLWLYFRWFTLLLGPTFPFPNNSYLWLYSWHFLFHPFACWVALVGERTCFYQPLKDKLLFFPGDLPVVAKISPSLLLWAKNKWINKSSESASTHLMHCTSVKLSVLWAEIQPTPVSAFHGPSSWMTT